MFGETGCRVVKALSGTKNTEPPEPICSMERHGWYSYHQLRSPLSFGRSTNMIRDGRATRGTAPAASAIDDASACACVTAIRSCAGMYASVASPASARRVSGPPKIVYEGSGVVQRLDRCWFDATLPHESTASAYGCVRW